MALLVEQKAPKFSAKAVVGGNVLNLNQENAFKIISSENYTGMWLVLFFYPLDFTFVCPTEIEEFGKYYEEFKANNCEVLACSTDSHQSHLAWRTELPSLRNLPYPMLADFTKEISREFEILFEPTGFALRGLYIIDPDGIIKYSVIHSEKIGRNVQEILRVLKALQTGEKTACNWQPGDNTLG